MLSCGRKPILRMVLASRRLSSPDDGSDRASELFFSRFDMPRPKPPGYLFDLVRTKIFASFELVAQSAPDDGPVGGAILIRRKSPARWLVRDAVLPNFKLLDQDQSSNSHRACAAHGFAANASITPSQRIRLLLLNNAHREGHQCRHSSRHPNDGLDSCALRQWRTRRCD